MKSLLIAVLTAMTLLATVAVHPAPAADAAETAKPKGRGRLSHLVAFKYKDTASAADIQKVEDAFAALRTKIPQIASYESGTNVSPEKLNKGFTHAYLLTFHSSQDRDEYLVHPEHKAFGSLLGPYLADAFVIDYWTAKPAKAAKGEKPAKSGKKKKTAE